MAYMIKQLPDEAVRAYFSHHATNDNDDEIDLYELWLTIAANKLTILVIAFLSVAIGGSYAYLTTPTYEIIARYTPPSQADVMVLDVINRRFPEVNKEGKRQAVDTRDTRENAYHLFKQTLYSNKIRKRVFRPYLKDKIGLSGMQLEEFIDDFIKTNISISEPKIKKGMTSIEAINIKLTLQDKAEGVSLLVEMLSQVNKLTEQQLLTNLDSTIKNKITEREHRVSIALKSEKERREAEILRLSEASELAHALKMEDSLDVNSGFGVNEEYRRGYRVLDEQIARLKSRKDDAPFISELIKIRGEIDLLRQPIDTSSLVVSRVDEAPQEPLHPIKPKKQMILVISLFFGLVLGIGFVFFRKFFIEAKARHATMP